MSRIISDDLYSDLLALLSELRVREGIDFGGNALPDTYDTIRAVREAPEVERIGPHLTRHGAEMPESWVEARGGQNHG